MTSRLAKTSLIIFMGLTFACNAQSGSKVDPVLDKYAISILAKLQNETLARGNEACGYIYKISDSLKHTPIVRGKAEFCDSSPDDVPSNGNLLASFHNHGGFDKDYDSEVPTVDDMDMDRLDNIFGYVATPGGRVWRIRDGFAQQLCRDCVARDPDHDDRAFLPVKSSYTRKLLMERHKLSSND